MDNAPICESGDELYVRKGRRKNASANGEDFTADPDGFSEISGDVSERGKEEIAEIVSDEAASRMKAILKQPSSASSFDSATMQLRMSPGGSTRFSRRSRPELPPSSVTVTIAVSSVMGR